jgi:hypothetical protein
LGGGPFDNLSLNEDANGTLRIFASGSERFAPRPTAVAREDAALFTLRSPNFGDGNGTAPDSTHRTLPLDVGGGVGSDFVGRWLMYATDGPYFRTTTPTTTLFAAPIESGETRRIKLPYYVERIAHVRVGAIVIGTATPFALHFLMIDPSLQHPLVAHFALRDASGEEYEGDKFVSATLGARDLLAIPGSGHARNDSTHFVRGSTSVVFVGTSPHGFARLGALSITRDVAETDSLEVPSGWFEDWYGDTRGLFVGARVFALIGYELIEARIVEGRVVERQRINFMPHKDQDGWQ